MSKYTFTDEQIKQARNTEFSCMDLDDEITIAAWMAELLSTLFHEGEGFSGKRPFGNSGWTLEPHAALVEKGLLKGTVTRDEDGRLDGLNDEDYREFNALMAEVARSMAV